MLSTPIRLQFRTNQNPFTVTLRPTSVDAAESENLGVFINSATIYSQSRATAGIYGSFLSFHARRSHAFSGAIYNRASIDALYPFRSQKCVVNLHTSI